LIECVPTVSDDVVKLAVPLESVTVPRTVEPSLKVTVPVGTPLPGDTEVIVAVMATAQPDAEGFIEELTELVVAACFTVWVRMPDGSGGLRS
jgi:hypothetical protein